jgi:hypothetical protein
VRHDGRVQRPVRSMLVCGLVITGLASRSPYVIVE